MGLSKGSTPSETQTSLGYDVRGTVAGAFETILVPRIAQSPYFRPCKVIEGKPR